MAVQEKQALALHSRTGRSAMVLSVILLASGLVLRGLGLAFVSLDMNEFLIGWYDRLAADGFAALAKPFSNYTPPYLYLLGLASLTQGFLPKVAAIKLISILFDLANAFLVYQILKIKYTRGPIALLGAAGFLLLPTVLLNSAFWGQSDAIYTCFLLACVYFLMRDRPLPAMFFLGVSFAFKAQAFFLAPLVLLLILRKKIPWYYPGLVPVVYVLMMLPAAWMGRPWPDLMTIYLSQANTYKSLSMHAPNLYVFISNEYYTPALIGGILITLAVVIAWIVVCARRKSDLTPETILFYALVSVIILPFFLPKMHDRYLYLADVLSFLVAFYFPRLWFLALGYQLVSGMVYSLFLLPSIAPIGRHRADLLLKAAALLGTFMTGLLFWTQRRLHLTPET